MPATGIALTDAELVDLNATVPEDAAIVWGATWDGRTIPRGVRATTITALVGEMGAGFDGSGPSATLYRECGALLYDDTAGGLATLQYRHLADRHGVSAAVLP